MFEWPVDKLSLINRALAQTGENTVNQADDGSDEWNTCSPAYETALGVMMEDHGWSFATDVRTIPPAVSPPSDDQFDTAYPLPADLVHLIWVRVNDMPCVYDLLAGQLVLNAQGGPPPPVPPQTPAIVTIKGVFQTNADPSKGTPRFVAALEAYVIAAIFGGLKKQFDMADAARTRHDQQKPKRAMFNSRITASRRIRRPWPPVPSGWGGTGVPG
jgi:hypothetical protein